MPAVVICSTAFTTLGRAQATALGCPDLSIAVVPHPFGARTRDDVSGIAERCVADIDRLLRESPVAVPRATGAHPLPGGRADRIEAPPDQESFDRMCRERGWSDGLPLVPPTTERVERMLHGTRRAPEEVIARVAPVFGAATVERIAVNAAMSGCEPRYMPLLIAAVDAVCDPRFNLQGIQATTNPAAAWVIVNGPVAEGLGFNARMNCLGQGTWANATLGRALRLVLQNIGGARPGEMDRATQGQPGKYTFCCAENESASPWEPLHVERGYERDCSTVTVVGAAGTLNMNTHAKDAEDLLRVFADSLAYPTSNDYWYGGEPWVVLSPEHADILKQAGMSKADVKRRLWEQSKLAVARQAARDRVRTQHTRRAELGDVAPEGSVPISPTPQDIGLIVSGGAGTHSVYVPSFGNTRSVTRRIDV